MASKPMTVESSASDPPNARASRAAVIERMARRSLKRAADEPLRDVAARIGGSRRVGGQRARRVSPRDAADVEPGECEDHGKIRCEVCEFDGEVDLPAPIFWIVQGDRPDNGSPYDVPNGVWGA